MAEAGVALRELEARPVTDLTGVGEGIAQVRVNHEHLVRKEPHSLSKPVFEVTVHRRHRARDRARFNDGDLLS